jgi:uncharacterized protein (DUF697 family)
MDVGRAGAGSRRADLLQRTLDLNKMARVRVSIGQPFRQVPTKRKRPLRIGRSVTPSQKENCHIIIHGAATAAAGVGAGLAQLPVADHVALVPIQVAMIVALGNVFDVHLTESAAKGVIYTGVAATVGRAVSQILVGWIPGVGNAINAATAASLTEALGWATANRFDRGEIMPSK